MSRRSPSARRVAGGLFVLVLLGFAYSPILRAGLLGPDLLALASLRPPEEAWRAVLDAQGGALASFALSVSRALYGVDAPGPLGLPPALFYRLENLALLLVGVAGLSVFVRRLLSPWLGADPAVAAGRAAALLFVVHPLVPPAVAALAARGELVAFALAAWSGACFLRGRQEKRFPWTALACLFALGAGFASDISLLLPWCLVGAELVATRRSRPLRTRLRTATTTLFVFGGAVMLETLVRGSRHGVEALPVGVVALRQGVNGSGAAALFSGAVEELGLLVLPANPQVWGALGTLLAGAVFLVAMQPALGAARSAPRLWGWILVGWFATLVATEVVHAESSVSPRSLASVHRLLPSVAVMAFGLGVGATALSGLRRVAVPVACALGYAALAYGAGLPWISASALLEGLRSDVAAARAEYGSEQRVLVVDPPEAVAGLDPIGDSLRLLMAPAGTPAAEVGDVRAVGRQAFLALLREPEAFAEPSVVLLPAPEVLGVPGASRAGAARAHVPRVARRLERGAPSGALRAWRGDVRSPGLDLSPLEIAALVVTLPGEGPDPAGVRLGWRASDPELRAGGLLGAWSRSGGRWHGVFDLGDSLAWRLGGRVRLLWLEADVFQLEEAELQETLPAIGSSGPSIAGDDWLFEPPRHPEADSVDAAFSLGLLDLTTFAYREFPAERRASGRLRVHDVVGLVDAWTASGGRLVWTLDLRLDGRAVARERGRWGNPTLLPPR